jgi:uncharacterized protein (TIGR02246 family)
MTSRAEDAAAIRRLEQSWCTAWNGHNMRALANLLADDADFVTVTGTWLRGRKEFRQHHALYHATLFKRSTLTATGTTIRFVGSDLALTHVKWRLTGEIDLDGTPMKPRRGIFTQALVKSKGRWWILASHNTNRQRPRGTPVSRLLKPRKWK